ncbi:MAG: thymidine kinase [Patescibacteria group bacterium]
MKQAGTISVFTGPMFSGKSEQLVARLRRAGYAKLKVLVVKPKKDLRTVGEVVSRQLKDEERKFQKFTSMPAHTVSDERELFILVESSECQVLGVDEAQFFPEWFVDTVTILAWQRGLEVIISGLDMDAWRKPFGIMPQLIAIADQVHKLNAICFKCGAEARFTQKLAGSQQQVEIGDADKYEARCGNCFEEFQGQ